MVVRSDVNWDDAGIVLGPFRPRNSMSEHGAGYPRRIGYILGTFRIPVDQLVTVHAFRSDKARSSPAATWRPSVEQLAYAMYKLAPRPVIWISRHDQLL